MELIEKIRAEIDRRIKKEELYLTADNANNKERGVWIERDKELLSFLDTLQEPEISNELLEPTRAVRLPDGRWVTEKLARQIGINLLNKAADELALRAFPEKKSYSSVYDRVVDYNAVDRKNYRDGILAGAELMKKQMMEEAVEADVNTYKNLEKGTSWAEFVVEMPTNNLGDKVRIIILKEELK